MKEQGFASAACIIKNKKILLLHRIKNYDVWELPGGKIEFGESPEEAAVREAKEETGLIVKSLGLITISSEITPQKHHHIWFYYKCKILKGKIKIGDGEHKEYNWFTFNELKKLPDLALSVKIILPKLFKVIKCNLEQ